MARDPRYRPYRVALWVFYLLVVGVSSGIAIRSIVKNLSGPAYPVAEGGLPTRAALRVCVTELEALHKEQNERAWRLGTDAGEGDAVHRWQVWSREWEQRVRDLAERCRLDASVPVREEYGGREELAQARDAVLAVHRAYAAQVSRFAQEEAKLAHVAAAALREARAALARPPERR
ncbi:MAG TPA: hypothetical protein VFK90_02460 [Anaeromyxobacter sp.]|nr:hypothetical protein [Anaeromyxobacter sp.]